MRSRGSMDVAPHSMLHARVISDLHFTRLYAPNNRHTFFHTAPYPAVWGMPRFKLNHGLVNKGYHLDPELFELVKRLVPQEPDQAQEFLTDEKNRAHVIEAIKKLPRLGVLETDTQYRERLASEFNACRETYEKMLGYTPVSFCWPWGSYNDTALGEARKAGFKVFFTTLPGMNPYGRSRAVRRFAVREGSGEELLSTVKKASSVWQVLPDELERLGRRLWARVVPD